MLCPRCKATFSEVVMAGLADRTRCPVDGWRLIVDRRGTRIGPFAIEAFLGVGGGGSSVWVARETLETARGPQSPTERKIALKFLPWPERAEERHEVTRFERGALLAESLDHPHIAKVFAHGRLSAGDGELLWVSMALLEGETLAEHASRRKVVPAREAVELVDQVLAALEVAHAAGIVHRDLKPANLHVSRVSAADGTELVPHVRVLDFGIARLTGASALERFGPFFPDDDPVAPELEQEVTGQHRICGTPEYMAPEQILGAQPDPRSDLYAVGVILYRLLTGQLPFRGRTRYELYHRHLHDAPPPAAPSLALPLPLEATMHRALAKKAEERFPDARAMRDALREAVGLPRVPRPRLFPTENELPRPERSVVAPALSLLPPVAAEPSIAAALPEAIPVVEAVEPVRSRRAWVVGLAAVALIGLGILVGSSLAREPAVEVGLTPTSSAR
jgi:serine/threonine-protein kinase